MTADRVQLAARSAGGLYLLVILCGVFAEFGVRAALVDRSDAAATAARILAAEPLFRLGLVADLLAAFAYLGVAFLLYLLFRPVSRGLATLSLILGTGGSVIMAGNLVNLFAPLILLKTGAGPGAGEMLQLQALAFLRLHAVGYNVTGLFFGSHLLVLGLLALRSGFLPRLIGYLLAAAGPAWLIYLLAVFLSPPAAGLLFPYVPLLSLVAEAALSLWLTICGVDRAAWEKWARGDRSGR